MRSISSRTNRHRESRGLMPNEFEPEMKPPPRKEKGAEREKAKRSRIILVVPP